MGIRRLRLDGFLSFAPGSEPFELRPLNVLIGPNGSGKSNLIEALGLLAATPDDLAGAVRRGGGIRHWVWKGMPEASEAVIEVLVPSADGPADGELPHRLSLGSNGERLQVLERGDCDSRVRLCPRGPPLSIRSRRRNDLDNIREGKCAEDYRVSEKKMPRTNPSCRSGGIPTISGNHVVGRTYSGIRTYTDWTFGNEAPASDGAEHRPADGHPPSGRHQSRPGPQ